MDLDLDPCSQWSGLAEYCRGKQGQSEESANTDTDTDTAPQLLILHCGRGGDGTASSYGSYRFVRC